MDPIVRFLVSHAASAALDTVPDTAAPEDCAWAASCAALAVFVELATPEAIGRIFYPGERRVMPTGWRSALIATLMNGPARMKQLPRLHDDAPFGREPC